MTNVIDLPVITTLDLPSDKLLEAAMGRVDDVLILGWDKSGELYFASGKADGGHCLWLMELAKKQLLEMAI